MRLHLTFIEVDILMKRAVIISVVIIIAIALTRSDIVNMLLSLILAGTLPGTSIILPFWAMMAIYCTITSLLVAWYAESLIVAHRMHKASTKQRMPKRRYSHI